MPKYLITATAFRRSEDGQEAYSPRTFTFEVTLDQPWSAKNSSPVGDLAFNECNRAFGWWPKHNPQIDSVVEVHSGGLPGSLRSRLAAAALMTDEEASDFLQDLQSWDLDPTAWAEDDAGYRTCPECGTRTDMDAPHDHFCSQYREEADNGSTADDYDELI